MHIGQFSDSFWPIVDGVGRVMYSYAETLSQMGHTMTTVATRLGYDKPKSNDFVYINYRGIPVPRVKPYRVGIPRLDYQYRRSMRPMSFDIVHAHSPFPAGMEALRISKRYNIPIVGTFHTKFYDDFYLATGIKAAAELAVKWVAHFYTQCDEVWAVNKGTAQVLRDYGYEGDIIIMPNGVVVRKLDEAAIKDACSKWHLSEAPMLLFVGQLNWKKNIKSVLESCAAMRRSGRQFQLVMAGQGPDEKAVAATVESLGLAPITVLTGHITDNRLLTGLYARADLLVFPSLYDCAPMVLREAAAMSTPALLIRGSDASDIIEDRSNGFLCDNNVESIRAAIEEVLDSPNLKAIGERAKATIPIEWPQIMIDVLKRYEALIEKRPAGRPKPDKRWAI